MENAILRNEINKIAEFLRNIDGKMKKIMKILLNIKQLFKKNFYNFLLTLKSQRVFKLL